MNRQAIYGRQPVLEVLAAGRRQVYSLTVSRLDRRVGVVEQICAAAQKAGVPLRDGDGREMDRICAGNHQGVMAEVSEYPYADMEGILGLAAERSEPLFLLLLDHVQDPQNLGAMLRSAEAAGVHGVVIPKHRAVEVTPAVVRASAGAAEHMRIARVSNVSQVMERLKPSGVWFAGLEGVENARLYTEADLKGPLGLVVGSEGDGMARLVRERCDFLIRLPMRGKIGSLNAAAAAAIALYEIRRQRDASARTQSNA